MKKIKVNTTTNNYNIIINNSFDLLQQYLSDLGLSNKKICIITDDNVSELYLEEVSNIISKISTKVSSIVIPHGETNKNLDTINIIYNKLLDNKFDRDSVLVALGGGVTGDMVGFACATYMRGIQFIQIPTTLLSQVDSSIGGKTGVDYKGYKNVIGAFYQPMLVYINTMTLQTIPKREFNAGMGEVIKHGLIADKNYFDFINNNINKINDLDNEVIEQLIEKSCIIKSEVVSQDEKEKGIRAILNFGHTVGHAVEKLLDFKLLHGECVAVGMIAAAYLSHITMQISIDELKNIEQCIEGFELPTKINKLDDITIFNDLFYDKKTKNDTLNFIILDGIGKCEIRDDLNRQNILSAIKYIL